MPSSHTLRFALFTLLVGTVCADAQASKSVDRFTGEVTYSTPMPSPQSAQTGMGMQAIVKVDPDGNFKNAAILLDHSGQDWKYLSCHETHWLVDNHPMRALPAAAHNGHVGSGFVLEFIIQPLPSLQVVRQFAAAKKIEFEVCGDQFAFDAADMRNLAELSADLQNVK